MDNSDHIDLAAALKKLLAEKKSQEARLEEYAKILTGRDNEIEMLQKDNHLHKELNRKLANHNADYKDKMLSDHGLISKYQKEIKMLNAQVQELENKLNYWENGSGQ